MFLGSFLPEGPSWHAPCPSWMGFAALQNGFTVWPLWCGEKHGVLHPPKSPVVSDHTRQMRMETKVVLVHFSFLKLLSEKKIACDLGCHREKPQHSPVCCEAVPLVAQPHWSYKRGGLQILRYYSLRERRALLLNMRVETRKAAWCWPGCQEALGKEFWLWS